MKQLGHYETLGKMPKLNIDCVLYAHNVSRENFGLILRSADIFGVKSIYYFQEKNSVNQKRLSKLSRNSGVPVVFTTDIEPLLSLKAEGYQLAALEVTESSIPLRKGNFKPKVCFIIGNEKNGIPENILNIADRAYHIEMTGSFISSLNAAVAASIALYELNRFFLTASGTKQALSIP